ncbi:alpha-L-fucosidase, partial [Rhizobium ruizarguesonis]
MNNLQSLALPEEKKAWLVHDRFGMFVHWGLYALPASHEWVKSREELNDADYQKYFDHFDTDLYDPSEWDRRAKAAGMKYVVLT